MQVFKRIFNIDSVFKIKNRCTADTDDVRKMVFVHFVATVVQFRALVWTQRKLGEWSRVKKGIEENQIWELIKLGFAKSLNANP